MSMYLSKATSGRPILKMVNPLNSQRLVGIDRSGKAVEISDLRLEAEAGPNSTSEVSLTTEANTAFAGIRMNYWPPRL